ncbi:hypothetical protein V144x_05200 [Gimesia aquarii]|uniref:Uncharacterized protein n=1 Tax=Gimesia aquarii TaxID=2527964 RepID=A0A517VPZ5_9PLAN|nr:hypothetical protein V144x_05200 [Gimesia aquarii]
MQCSNENLSPHSTKRYVTRSADRYQAMKAGNLQDYPIISFKTLGGAGAYFNGSIEKEALP